MNFDLLLFESAGDFAAPMLLLAFVIVIVMFLIDDDDLPGPRLARVTTKA